MKKLLLCVFTLTYALTMQSMGNKELTSSTSGLSAALTSVPGMVNRYMQPAFTQSVDLVKVENIDGASSSAQTTASSNQAPQPALRSNIPAHHSWNRISIADAYPPDDENTWDIVTNDDAKDAATMHDAQKVLDRVKEALPTNLKPCIAINIHESKNPLNDLETARELIWASLTRTDPNFATSYIETLHKNFDPCRQYDQAFDASKVYAHFAYDQSVGMSEPNETFAELIKEKLEIASKENDDKTKWFMRQFGFMFRDPATKQTYDTYLSGGEKALKTLMIPETQKDELLECFNAIADAKYRLKELKKTQKQ